MNNPAYINRRAPFFIIIVVVVLIAWFKSSRTADTPIARAYRQCADCGLTGPEVDELVNTIRDSTLSRAENVELFRSTFKDKADAAECEPCTVAILDAAGKWWGTVTRV